MGLSVKNLRITQPRSSINNPPYDQVITGVGFQPKCAIFTSTQQTATGTAANARLLVGISDGTTHCSVVGGGNDGITSGTSVAKRRYDSTKCIAFLDVQASPAAFAFSTVKTFDADGLTITWPGSGGLDNTARLINAYLIGGSDITNVKVGTFQQHQTNGSSITVTTGFQPDFIFMISTGLDTAPSPAFLGSGYRVGVGFTTGASAYATAAFSANNGSSPTTGRAYQDTADSCSAVLSDGTFDSRVRVTAVSSTGFTVQTTNASGGSFNDYFFYLAIQGGQHKIGVATQPSSTGNQTLTTTFLPSGIFAFSRCQAATSTVDTPANFSIGASDGSADKCCTSIYNSGITPSVGTPTEADSEMDDTHILRLAGHSAGAYSVSGAAKFSSFGSTSAVLNWDTADATARQYAYWIIGANAVAPVDPPPSVDRQGRTLRHLAYAGRPARLCKF